MIEQTLTVTAVDGFVAFLKPQQKPSCEGCNGQCGSKIFTRLFGDKEPALRYEFEQQLSVGQKVKLALDDSHVLKSSLLVYFLPLVFAFGLPLLLDTFWSLAEAWLILSALVAGFFGFSIAKKQLKKVQYDIKIIKIYPNSLPITQIDGD